MNTKTITNEYRLAQWAGIVKERQESGLTIKVYCNEKGIHENSYFYWQRKLREFACQGIMKQPLTTQLASTPIPEGWALCTTTTEEPGNGIEIGIGKCRITATTQTDQKLLAAVCKTLASIC